MKVPFIDFTEQYHTIKAEILPKMERVLEKGNFILGEETGQFEDQFARYCGAKYGVGVNSGTDALYLAVSALGIGPGDEVILPTFTFIATALCVSYTGAKAVLIDIEDETYNIDPEKLKALITPRTKAIIPVHLYGQAANMDEINAIAKAKGIAVIEDAAQAHGATYKGKMVGSLGEISCFSFYPTKSLGGAGDGGMVVTSDQKIYERVLMLRDYGRQGRYEHKIKGFNSRLDTIQAVVLSAKLKHLNTWNEMRRTNADLYREHLGKVPGIVLPTLKPQRTHVYQTYAIRVKNNRDGVLKHLQDKGVGALIHYPIPVHLQEAYAELKYKKGDFPVAEKFADEELSLPMFPHMTKEQIAHVSETVKEALAVKK